MDINKIKDKIKKLLSMNQENGACEQEVQSALEAVKRLQVKYGLSDEDVFGTFTKEVLKRRVDGFEFSTVVNPWALDLLTVIAEEYGCQAMIFTNPGAKTKIGGVVGFEKEVDMAQAISKCAYDTIMKEMDSVKKIARNFHYTAKDITSIGNAYGNGFVAGIKESFRKKHETSTDNAQSEDTENSNSLVLQSFALALTIPKEVSDAMNDMSQSNFDSSKADRKARDFDRYAVKGYLDGLKFNINTMIEEVA